MIKKIAGIVLILGLGATSQPSYSMQYKKVITLVGTVACVAGAYLLYHYWYKVAPKPAPQYLTPKQERPQSENNKTALDVLNKAHSALLSFNAFDLTIQSVAKEESEKNVSRASVFEARRTQLKNILEPLLNFEWKTIKKRDVEQTIIYLNAKLPLNEDGELSRQQCESGIYEISNGVCQQKKFSTVLNNNIPSIGYGVAQWLTFISDEKYYWKQV